MSEADNKLIEAQVALRDAEINKEIEANSTFIATHGRCGKYRGHFDFVSFMVGSGISIFIGMLLSSLIGMHR